MGWNISAIGPARDQTANPSNVRTDRRTNGPTGGRTDQPMDRWTDVRTHGLIDLPQW